MSGAIVMTPIVPAKFDEAAFWTEIAWEAEKISKEMQRDFEKSVKYWKRKVVFERLVEVGPKNVTIFVGTDDEIYRYVDKGTKGPYPIRPKGPWLLRWRTGGQAKTTPGSLRSVNRGPAAGPWAAAKEVQHPGIKARGFSDLVEKKWRPIIPKRMQKAIDRAARASGHGL